MRDKSKILAVAMVAVIMFSGLAVVGITDDSDADSSAGGVLYMSGNNNRGQQGTGDTINNLSPNPLRGYDVEKVVLSNYATYFLTADGKLYGIGDNSAGQLGQGNTTNAKTPVQIGSTLGTIADMYAYGSVFCFITGDGKLYGCGVNTYGQLGQGNTVSSYTTPVQIGSTLGTIAKVVCSYYTVYFITSDGKLYGCGQNTNGQLGNGTRTNSSTPIQIGSTLGTITDVACSNNNVYFITSTGDLHGCGYNNYGQLGQGDTETYKTTPVQIGSTLGTISKVVCSVNHLHFITSSGDLYGCGQNSYYQIKTGTTNNVTTPEQMGGTLGTITDVACSNSNVYFITSTGDLYGVGHNGSGQLGQGNTSTSSIPRKMNEWIGSAEKVICSSNSVFCITSDGKLYGCGNNNSRQQGNGTTVTNTVILTQIGSTLGTISKVTCTDGHIGFIVSVPFCTVTIQPNNPDYGSVDYSGLANVPAGSAVDVIGNTITINGTTITATPTIDTVEYDYRFTGWSISDGATINGNTTITATFTRVLQAYTVTISANNTAYGTVSPSSIANVPYGSAITVSGSTLTINGTTITATPTTDTAQYDYGFTGWSASDNSVVGGDMTITATFSRAVKTYTVTVVSNNTAYGTVSPSSIANVPYGSAITVSGSTLTINGTTITATPTAALEDGTTYGLSQWSTSSGTVGGDMTITAYFEQHWSTNPLSITKSLLWLIPVLLVAILVVRWGILVSR